VAQAHHVGVTLLIGAEKMQQGLIKRRRKNPDLRYLCDRVHIPHDIPRHMTTGKCRYHTINPPFLFLNVLNSL